MYKKSNNTFRAKLRCETNTIEMKNEILESFLEEFDNIDFENNTVFANFEHGQWFITAYDPNEERDRIFSVNDTEVNGSFQWSFEEC